MKSLITLGLDKHEDSHVTSDSDLFKALSSSKEVYCASVVSSRTRIWMDNILSTQEFVSH
jgi:hypothetical protein